MNRATLVSRPENSDDLRRRMLNSVLAVIVVLLAILVVGCDDSEQNTGLERDRGSGSMIDGGGAGTAGESSQIEAQTVAVTLKDDEIAMPTIIKPGPTTFNVVNAGTQKHGFRIEGSAQQAGLGSDLDPAGSAQLDADLAPGTYTVRCPMADHNHSLQLTVQP